MVQSLTQPLGDLLRRGKFAPASIQRAYQWHTHEAGQLLGDLEAIFQRMGLDPGEAALDVADAEDAGEASAEEPLEGRVSGVTPRVLKAQLAPDCYFLGTIILLKPRNAIVNSIYDGLQRIVTITLLLAALRDTWTDIPAQSELAIADLLYDRGDKKRRLTYQTAGHSLEAIVDGSGFKERRRLNDGDLHMRDVSQHLRERFDGRWDSARRAAFLAFLTETVMVTVTETTNHSVAYQMFIGANARGLRLSIGDVVKSLVADLVRSNGGTVEQVNVCANAWNRAQQKLQRDFDDFLHALEVYLVRDEGEDKEDSRIFAQAHTTGEKLQQMFDETTPPAEICAWMTQDFEQTVAIFERARDHLRLGKVHGVELAFRQLSFLSWTEWQPLLIAIGLKHADLRSAKFSDEIHRLKRACYIVELLDWSESRRRKAFVTAARMREADKDPFAQRAGNKALFFPQRGPQLRSARRALGAPLTSMQKRGALVRYVETLQWGGSVPLKAIDDASVEHVLPQRPFGDWHRAFSDEEREDLTNRLGNLCILDKAVNHRVGNLSWADKLQEYVPCRGDFRGVDRVLRKAQEMIDAKEPHPWCARAIRELTHDLVDIAAADLKLPPAAPDA